jgi:hypothetical protein
MTTRHSLAMAAGLILLAAPRIVRMAYPQIWIEDESYLNGAFMLARGFLPYRDFPLPHFPALEGLLAAVFLVAPISIRSAEVFTQLAAFLGSVLVYVLGRRLGDSLTGAAAALVFATSALLFRYHVFEREVFVVMPVLGAIWLASGPIDERKADRRALAVGLLLFLALAIKLTAIAALAGAALQLAVQGRRRFATITASTALGLLAVATVVLTIAFGTPFVVQVFVFRAVHAAFPSLGAKIDEMRYTMDVSLAFGAVGIALMLWTGDARRWLAVLAQLFSGFVFLVLLNPTYWAHTGIELLPWLSLAAGYVVAAAIRSVRSPGRGRRTARGAAFAAVAAAIVLVVFVMPVRNLNWQAGDDSVYGFGYRDRREIDAAAQFVRSHSGPDALVATPSIIAFAANRREVVPYPEIAGEIDEITAIVRRDGFVAALKDPSLRGRTFWESVEASRDRMRPVIESALKDHKVAAVIDDSPDDLMPVLLVDVPQHTLEADGYRLAAVSPHYETWIR